MNFSKLDQLIDTMPQRGIPGCEFVLTHHGKEIYRRASGLEKAVSGKKVDSDTLWWIYSASKISTCTAALQLIEQGKLSLDDKVSKYLPAFEHMMVRTENDPVPCEVPMKIIHLFTMTGGLDYDMSEPHVKEVFDAGGSTVEVCNAMGHKELVFVPGSHWKYSLCHDVLGAVVSVISGMSLGDYLKKNLWLPLGMENTGFTPDDAQRSRLADMYRFGHSRGTAEPIECPYRPYSDPNYESGGGGVFSRSGDYIKLMTALSLGGISPEGVRILKEDTVKMMEVNRLDETCHADLYGGARLYGYGWGLCGRVHEDPVYSLSRSSVGEFGWDGAAAAFALADRKKEVAMYFGTHVMGCNYCYNLVHMKLRDLSYEAIED